MELCEKTYIYIYIYIKFAMTERRNYLVSETKFYTTMFFTESLLATEMTKNWNTYKWTCLFRTFSIRITKILMYQY